MKATIRVGLALGLCVLLSSGAPVYSWQDGATEVTVAPAGVYRLTALPLRACVSLTGGYTLTPAVIEYTGTPCCCVYLPAAMY